MARRYVRDARGRFASGSYQGQTSGRGSRLRTPGKAPQKGSTIRAKAPTGTISATRRKPQAQPSRSGIRPTGGLPRRLPTSSIRPTGRAFGRRANTIKPYRPATADGQMGKIDRQIDKTMKGMVDEVNKLSRKVKKARPEIDQINRELERMNAQAMAKRLSKRRIDREIAGVELGTTGGRLGAKAIQRRMQRAASAAARGSKPAAKARQLYANQLAFMGPGKPNQKAKSNLRPGPRNTQGPPKRKRKPKR